MLTRRRSVRLVAVVGALVFGPGCSLEPGSGDCRETELLVEPVTVTDPLATLELIATLTADGDPVAGAEISFSTIVEGTPNVPEGQTGGRHIGNADTGPDGVARFVREEGIDGLLLPSERLTGYRADFTPLEPIDGERYCRVRVEGPVG